MTDEFLKHTLKSYYTRKSQLQELFKNLCGKIMKTKLMECQPAASVQKEKKYFETIMPFLTLRKCSENVLINHF